MADGANAADKTEKPSAQKLIQARKQGHVVRSRDWGVAVGVVLSLKLVVALLPGYLEDFRMLFAQSFASLHSDGSLENMSSIALSTAMVLILKMVLPLCLVPLVGILVSQFPGGFVFALHRLSPSLSKLNPINYVSRLSSSRTFFELAMSMLKAGVLGAAMWHVMHDSVSGYLRLQALPLDQALLTGADMVLDGLMSLAMVFVLFAAVDMPAQVFFFMRSQRMSKQDQKEEHKSAEGAPQVKQRIRQLQRQMARRSVNKTVPTADVVIVNPEHYAVALKYDEARAQAPFVVAKGVDEMALYIREVAMLNNIETVPLPPLARAIYNTSQVNQQIPMPLYTAVAQVLSYVMQIKAFRNGRRQIEPRLPSELIIPPHLSEIVST